MRRGGAKEMQPGGRKRRKRGGRRRIQAFLPLTDMVLKLQPSQALFPVGTQRGWGGVAHGDLTFFPQPLAAAPVQVPGIQQVLNTYLGK